MQWGFYEQAAGRQNLGNNHTRPETYRQFGERQRTGGYPQAGGKKERKSLFKKKRTKKRRKSTKRRRGMGENPGREQKEKKKIQKEENKKEKNHKTKTARRNLNVDH